MKLKNYQEDIVLRAVQIALEDQPDLLSDDDFVNDVAAFVLNRVPPRYVMSERGFLRLTLEHLDDDDHDRSLANVIELMMLVNRGVELVQGRRSLPDAPDPRRDEGDRVIGLGESVLGAVEFVHNYPQIIGRTVDARSGEPVLGATVTMYVNGDLAPAAGAGWINPYVTNGQTRGHFSFWPRPIRSERHERSDEVLFTVEHPDYETFQHVERVSTQGEFDTAQVIQGDRILSLAPFELQPAAVPEGRRS